MSVINRDCCIPNQSAIFNSVAANYIKQPKSYATNMNASLITNKRQAQMIFTGYERQVEAISQNAVGRPAVVFSGVDGPANNNLKNGAIFTNPETLYAIENTTYSK
jgi:hypothetical protein